MEGIWVSDFIVFFMFFRILKVAKDEHIRFILVSLESRAYGKAYMLKLYWRCLLRKARMRTTDQGREKKKTNTGCWNFKLSQLHNKTQLTAQSLRSSSERPHGAAAWYSQPGGGEAPLLPAEFLSLYWLNSNLLRLPHVQVMLPNSSSSHWKRQGFQRPGPASVQVTFSLVTWWHVWGLLVCRAGGSSRSSSWGIVTHNTLNYCLGLLSLGSKICVNGQVIEVSCI